MSLISHSQYNIAKATTTWYTNLRSFLALIRKHLPREKVGRGFVTPPLHHPRIGSLASNIHGAYKVMVTINVLTFIVVHQPAVPGDCKRARLSVSPEGCVVRVHTRRLK